MFDGRQESLRQLHVLEAINIAPDKLFDREDLPPVDKPTVMQLMRLAASRFASFLAENGMIRTTALEPILAGDEFE